MKVKAKITFRTLNPISQETALKMWGKGSRFSVVPRTGGRTYQLTSTGESDSVDMAREGLEEIIREIVEEDSVSNHVTEFVKSDIVLA